MSDSLVYTDTGSYTRSGRRTYTDQYGTRYVRNEKGEYLMIPHKKEHKSYSGPRKKRKRKHRRKKKPVMFKIRTRTQGGGRNPSQLVGATYTRANSNSAWILSSKYYSPYNANNIWQRTTIDANHGCPPYTEGGPFYSFFYHFPFDILNQGEHPSGWITANTYKYVGGFYPDIPWSTLGGTEFSYGEALKAAQNKPNVNSPQSDVYSYGAGAYNKFAPGKPNVDMGQFLYEIRDTVPMLMTSAKFFSDAWKGLGGLRDQFGPKSVADHWLNTQFGWLPFLGDLQRFLKTYDNVNKNLAQIRRDNGRWIRRRGSVAKIRESKKVSESKYSSCMKPTLSSYAYNASYSGHYEVYRDFTKDVWFSGAFRYWIPDTGSKMWEAKTIAHMFGVMPTPRLVWEIMPWSWLVDWQLNVGDIIANNSPGWADNRVSKYAYVMGKTHVELRVEDLLDLYKAPYRTSWRASLDWKRREEASPFGFGLSPNQLTGKQWSILAALAIAFA